MKKPTKEEISKAKDYYLDTLDREELYELARRYLDQDWRTNFDECEFWVEEYRLEMEDSDDA